MPAPKTISRPGAIDLALSSEERDAFCSELMKTKGLTGPKILEMARARGIDCGLAAAYTFKDGSLDAYCERLRRRAAKKTRIKESQGDPLDGTSDAESAGMDLAERLQEFTSSGQLDAIDLTDPEGVKTLGTLTLAARRLRSDDRAMLELRQKLLESEAKLADRDLKIARLEGEKKAAASTLQDDGTPLEIRARKLRELFGIAASLVFFCLLSFPSMTAAKRVDELRQRIDAARTAPDATRGMTDEQLEFAALANPPGRNINGWVTPYDPDHPFSLLKEYQFRYLRDESRFKAGLWGRQTGKDFTTEGEAVEDCHLRPGTQWMVAAPSERQSLDSLDKAKDWAKAFDLAIAGYDETREGGKGETLLKSAEITFANGSKIVAVPGKPDTVRGKSANILLTEFDFFEDPAATWRAILPSITNPLRGGEKKARLVTTPNGRGGAMDKIWSKEGGKMAWSKHLVTVYHAVLHGMPIDIAALQEAFGDDHEGFLQECLCRFLDASSVLLPYELIKTCESFLASETATPDELLAEKLPIVAGIDFGRISDPTVMATAQRALGNKRVRSIQRLKGMSTPDQIDVLLPMMKICERVCVDYTGPGVGFGDLAVKELGRWDPEHHEFGKIELCTFTVPFKRSIFPALRTAFEKLDIEIPVSSRLREDLHAMAQVITGGQYNYKAPRTDLGHSDECTALALMVRAGSSEAQSLGTQILNGGGTGGLRKLLKSAGSLFGRRSKLGGLIG